VFQVVSPREIRAKAKKSDKNNDGANLFKELWNAAVALRGSIEPADYKRYVLPLIFLRFLSLRYEQRVSEIKAEIADPQSDLFTTDKDLAREILEDPDNFLKRNVFLVPADARWDNIVKIARADDIKLRLDNILALTYIWVAPRRGKVIIPSYPRSSPRFTNSNGEACANAPNLGS
jgi:type I restriction-modification system DNA methylase subunit